MSLYHEAASVLQQDSSSGGNLRSRVFNNKELKSPPAQVYALALETCKWSAVLAEVIDHSQILKHEKKASPSACVGRAQADLISQLTPILSLLLVHDFLLAKGGIALPASHGLRATIDRHKSRLNAEFTRAKIRRKCSSVDALTEQVEASLYATTQHPRWIRVNALKSTLEKQLSTTFKDHQKADSVQQVLNGTGKLIYIDENVPNLVAVSPRFDFARSPAYKSGQIILQDKASCFPAYLLDPKPSEGDVIDGCAAPGNKTTHAAAIMKSYSHGQDPAEGGIHAFEKDTRRAKTLDKMVKLAGSDDFTQINQGQDFLKVDPLDARYANTAAILLDPSCSGSGIVGRDDMPELHLPTADGAITTGKPSKKAASSSKKRKRPAEDPDPEHVLVDDDGNTTVVSSEKDLETRLEALSSFQLTLLLHAFSFPAARKITYSTCSVHAKENEQVVLKALQSDVGKRRGWRVLPREEQVSGMRAWPVRGQVEACDGDKQVAESCIRAYKDDGRGVMGFFVVAFARDPDLEASSPPPTKKKSKKGKTTASNQQGQMEVKTHHDIPSESAQTPNANGRGIDGTNTGDDESESWSGFED